MSLREPPMMMATYDCSTQEQTIREFTQEEYDAFDEQLAGRQIIVHCDRPLSLALSLDFATKVRSARRHPTNHLHPPLTPHSPVRRIINTNVWVQRPRVGRVEAGLRTRQ